MAQWLVFTRADAPKFAKLLLWLTGLPRRGTHVGGGIHVEMPDVVANPCPLNVPGWTTRHRSWVAKPSNTGAGTDEFAVRLTPEIQLAWQARKSELTAAQRNWVQNHIDVASDIELLAAWKRTVAEPGGGSVEMVVESDDVEPEAGP